MKKSMSKILVCILSGFILLINVNAAECNYQEKAKLNEIASKVKTNYEVIEVKKNMDYIDPETGETGTFEGIETSFKISLYNITEDLYIIQTDNFTQETKHIFYVDTKDGVYSFESYDIENIIKYTYNVYSNSPNCSGDVLKTYNFTKPKVNPYSQYKFCEGFDELPYCKTYITEEIELNEGEVQKKISESTKNGVIVNAGEDTKLASFFKENKLVVIIGGLLVVGTGIVTVVIKRKRSAL